MHDGWMIMFSWAYIDGWSVISCPYTWDSILCSWFFLCILALFDLKPKHKSLLNATVAGFIYCHILKLRLRKSDSGNNLSKNIGLGVTYRCLHTHAHTFIPTRTCTHRRVHASCVCGTMCTQRHNHAHARMHTKAQRISTHRHDNAYACMHT